MFLNVTNLTVCFDSVVALDNVSFFVKKGEMVAMIGPNGAGKSTALKAICGLISPNKGKIQLNNSILNKKKPHQLLKEGICFVPQDKRVFSSMTVYENLEIGLFNTKNSNKKRMELEKIFYLFPILKKKLSNKASNLSGGEQQMLAIARSLIFNPQLLLLDEPTAGLSPKYVEIVFEKLKEINLAGLTIIFVEHNTKAALKYSHRVYVFKTGAIELEDYSKNLLVNKNLDKVFFGE